MKGSRVVVTGMGAVTPLGLDVDSSWAAICAGQSGAAMIDRFDASAFTTRFSASVKDFSVEGYLETRDARRMDPFIQYGMVAGIQAFRDSGFEVSDANAARIGCAIGSGIGGIGSIEDTALLVEQKGPFLLHEQRRVFNRTDTTDPRPNGTADSRCVGVTHLKSRVPERLNSRHHAVLNKWIHSTRVSGFEVTLNAEVFDARAETRRKRRRIKTINHCRATLPRANGCPTGVHVET